MGHTSERIGDDRIVSNLLPDQFEDLEPFVDWALPTERERNNKRIASTMPAIEAFYDAMLPRARAIIAHLDSFPVKEMPVREMRLMNLLLSLAEVANAVEIFKQPTVIDGYDSRRTVMVHEEDE
jgi:hypothetical protein